MQKGGGLTKNTKSPEVWIELTESSQELKKKQDLADLEAESKSPIALVRNTIARISCEDKLQKNQRFSDYYDKYEGIKKYIGERIKMAKANLEFLQKKHAVFVQSNLMSKATSQRILSSQTDFGSPLVNAGGKSVLKKADKLISGYEIYEDVQFPFDLANVPSDTKEFFRHAGTFVKGDVMSATFVLSLLVDCMNFYFAWKRKDLLTRIYKGEPMLGYVLRCSCGTCTSNLEALANKRLDWFSIVVQNTPIVGTVNSAVEKTTGKGFTKWGQRLVNRISNKVEKDSYSIAAQLWKSARTTGKCSIKTYGYTIKEEYDGFDKKGCPMALLIIAAAFDDVNISSCFKHTMAAVLAQDGPDVIAKQIDW